MRRLGASSGYGSAANAYGTLYHKLYYSDAHINLDKRRSGATKLDRVKEEEWPTVIAMAVAMCERAHVEVGDIIESMRAYSTR
jgi:hypothetical protein